MSIGRHLGVSASSLPGVSRVHLLSVVEDLVRRAEEVSTATPARDAIGAFNRYLAWANETARQLGSVVAVRDVERLVLTSRHWALQGLDPAANGDLLNLIWLELDQRKQDLLDLAEDLRQFGRRWSADAAGRLLVVDTNFYLHHDKSFEEISWREVGAAADGEPVTVVVPLVVVDELDRAKRDDLRARARRTLKMLHEIFIDPSESVLLAELTRARLLPDPPGHQRLPDADMEIIDRAISLASLSGLPTSIVTYDVGMSFRAKMAGADVKWFERPNKSRRES